MIKIELNVLFLFQEREYLERLPADKAGKLKDEDAINRPRWYVGTQGETRISRRQTVDSYLGLVSKGLIRNIFSEKIIIIIKMIN